MANAAAVLPEPDSPSTARPSPRASVKLTPSAATAGSAPGARNSTRRSRTSSSAPVSAIAGHYAETPTAGKEKRSYRRRCRTVHSRGGKPVRRLKTREK